jgi:hypothetical protein
MVSPQTRDRSLPSTLALFLALIGAASMLYYHEGLFMPRVVAVRNAQGLGNGYLFGNDFYQIWLTSRELLRARRDPYSPEMTRDLQMGVYGRPLDPTRPGDPVDQRAFPYPAYTDLLLWPAAEVPFPPMRIVMLALLSALTVASPLLWLRALDWRPGWKWTAVILLLTMCSYPALEALFSVQIGLLVAFLLPASIVALQGERFLLAGILLALCTIKPQVAALTIFYLLIWAIHDWNRTRRFLLGFFSTVALLLTTSLLVLPHWIQSWIRTILAYRRYTQPPLVREVLTSSLGPSFAGPAALFLTAVAIIAALVVAWQNRNARLDSLAFWRTLGLLLSITTITILPGQAVYDHLILVPAILVLVRYRSMFLQGNLVPRTLLSMGGLLLLWPWIAAFVLTILHPLLSSTAINSTAVLSLPIRSAASLPFAVLALLVWIWRITRATSQEVF